MTEPAYLSISEVMAILGVSRSTVKRMLADRTLTRVKPTGKERGAVRIPRAEVDALMPRRRKRAA